MEDSMTEESKVGQIKTEETLKKQSKEEVDDSEEEESQSDEDAKNTLDSETHLNGHTDLSNDKGTLVKDEVDIQPKTQNDSMKERIESDIIEQPLAEPPQITSKPSDYADFAAIHSFLTMFGVELDLPNVSLIDLEQIFSTNHRLSFEKDNIGILEVLYMKLFRKLKQSYRYSPVANVTSDRLFKTIVRYVYLVRFEQAEQVQFQGYESLSTEQRLKLFKSLCEIQFEENSKFRSTLQETFKGDNASALRLEPFGVEQEGYHIWFQEDQDCNFIVYASGATNENIEEWDVRARTFEELEVYIADLKSRTEVNPKDTVEERSKVVREEKEKEKEKRRQEREEKRKAAAELAAKKKKGKGRGRRAKEVAPVEISSSESEEEEDDGCVKCLRNKQDDQVLLCDTCDAGYHATCLVPPVTTIPEGDWYGPHCMHVTLAQKLAERMAAIRKKVQAKERKSRRMQFYGIRQSNIIESNSNEPQTGRRAGRTKVDYRFSEYDRTVEDALRSSEEENDRPSRRSNGLSRTTTTTSSSGRVRRKRFNIEAEDYGGSDDQDPDYSGADSGRSDVDDFLVPDDFDEEEERHRNKYLRRSKRDAGKYSSASRSRRRKRRRRGRYDDDDTDDDGDDDFSDRGDSEDDAPRRSTRILRKGPQVTYKDTLDDDIYGSDADGDKEVGGKRMAEDDDEYKNSDGAEDSGDDDKEKSDSDASNSGNEEMSNLNLRKRKKNVIESDDEDESKNFDKSENESEKSDNDGEKIETSEINMNKNKQTNPEDAINDVDTNNDKTDSNGVSTDAPSDKKEAESAINKLPNNIELKANDINNSNINPTLEFLRTNQDKTDTELKAASDEQPSPVIESKLDLFKEQQQTHSNPLSPVIPTQQKFNTQGILNPMIRHPTQAVRTSVPTNGVPSSPTGHTMNNIMNYQRSPHPLTLINQQLGNQSPMNSPRAVHPVHAMNQQLGNQSPINSPNTMQALNQQLGSQSPVSSPRMQQQLGNQSPMNSPRAMQPQLGSPSPMNSPRAMHPNQQLGSPSHQTQQQSAFMKQHQMANPYLMDERSNGSSKGTNSPRPNAHTVGAPQYPQNPNPHGMQHQQKLNSSSNQPNPTSSTTGFRPYESDQQKANTALSQASNNDQKFVNQHLQSWMNQHHGPGAPNNQHGHSAPHLQQPRQPYPMYHPQYYSQHQQAQRPTVHNPKPHAVNYGQGHGPGNFPGFNSRHFYGGPPNTSSNPYGSPAPHPGQQVPSHGNTSPWPYIPQQSQYASPPTTSNDPASSGVKRKTTKKTSSTNKKTAKQTDKLPVSSGHQNEATKNMNYFRNMVIGGDNNDRMDI